MQIQLCNEYIRAFVRGSNAVVVNKKSHELRYTPIHEKTIPSVGSFDRRVLCSVCILRARIRESLHVPPFSLVSYRISHDRSAESKEIGRRGWEGVGREEAKRRKKVKQRVSFPSSTSSRRRRRHSVPSVPLFRFRRQ